MQETFADVLGYYVQRSEHTTRQVAKLGDLPHRTVANWMSGVVLKPQQWQGVAKVAAALKLSEVEASRLLEAAGHPPIPELRQTTNGKDLNLLAPWPPPEQAPFQAVADLPYFVGRETAMDELEKILQQGQQVAICNLHGMGGVGKTSLAAHLAYRLRAQFPDGALWARLDTTDTMTILSAFAEAYGKDVSGYRDVESRAAVVRSLLADKRVLVVLDNAESSEQVRPLLPPTTGQTAVILTTRHDLAVADQMHRFPIESFDPASGESLAVFTYFLGRRTVQQWQPELQTVADLLGHLPLAVAIAAGQLAYGRVPIPDFLSQLQQSDQRLDALIREDRNVRLTFDLSYRALSPEMQQFFAALGTFGGDDFGVTAVAYVTELSEPDAQARLDALCQLSLVQVARPLRYRLHPLLRDYAREQILSENLYVRMASFFIKLVESLETTDYQALLPDVSNILATVTITYGRQMHEQFLQCVTVYHLFFFAQGLIEQQIENLNHALQIAADLENILLLSDLLLKKGRLKVEIGYFEEGEPLLLEALTLIENGDSHNERNLRLTFEILNALGTAYNWQEEYQKARKYYEASRKIAKEIDYKRAIIVCSNNLGEVLHQEGLYDEALLLYEEALALARYSRDNYLIINILHCLASAHSLKQDYDQAIICLQEGEKLGRLHGHTTALIGVLWLQSFICYRTDDLIKADVYVEEAITIARQAGYLRSLSFLLGESGKWSLEKGDYDKAITCLSEAISIARQQGLKGRHFRILHYWSELYLAQKRFDEAVQIWNEVLEQVKEKIYAAAAYWGLTCTAKIQKDENLAQQYHHNWQVTLEKLTSHEKKLLNQWLPDLPVES